MKQLLIFSDMDGTLDGASVKDFMNLFSLVRKYCDKKGYDNFSFNVVTGALNHCRFLYSDIFLEVKHKLGEHFSFDIFTEVTSKEKKSVIDAVVGGSAISKGGVDDKQIITKEVLFFDDCPVSDLKPPYGKDYFEGKYDINFNCIIATDNIRSVLGFFENKLSCDHLKKRGEKIIN